MKKIKELKGEYIHLIRGGKPSKKIYLVRGYCRTNRAWELEDSDDISRCRYLKGDKEAVISDY